MSKKTLSEQIEDYRAQYPNGHESPAIPLKARPAVEAAIDEMQAEEKRAEAPKRRGRGKAE